MDKYLTYCKMANNNINTATNYIMANPQADCCNLMVMTIQLIEQQRVIQISLYYNRKKINTATKARNELLDAASHIPTKKHIKNLNKLTTKLNVYRAKELRLWQQSLEMDNKINSLFTKCLINNRHV